MCINTEPPASKAEALARASKEMYVGRIVSVIDSGSEYGGWYEFEEYPGLIWLQKNFAPISEIDEREMIREGLNQVILN